MIFFEKPSPYYPVRQNKICPPGKNESIVIFTT
jgi:hypothetical protein